MMVEKKCSKGVSLKSRAISAKARASDLLALLYLIVIPKPAPIVPPISSRLFSAISKWFD